MHIFYDSDRFSDLSVVYKSRPLKVKCAFRTVECEIGSFLRFSDVIFFWVFY